MNTDTFPIATAGFATADPIALTDTGSEYDIQWMPPGYQEPHCFVGGKPQTLKFTCKAQHATALNALLQNLIAKAAAGEGDRPLTDYNHEDGAASSRPIKLYWGGDDPKTGGIRLVGKWTAKAIAGIRDGEWDRFSPEWQFDPVTFEPVGISANLGGLVNRAAFPTIQSVKARLSAPGHAGEGVHAFIARAKAVASDQNISLFDAVIQTARAHWDLYQDCVHPVSRSRRAQASQARRSKEHPFVARAREAAEHGEINGADMHPFVARAKAIADDQNIPIMEAAIQTSRTDYPLYQDWLRCFAPRKRTAKAIPAKASAARTGGESSAEHPFIAQAKALADEHKISVTAAQARLAGQNYQLYREYLAACQPR